MGASKTQSLDRSTAPRPSTWPVVVGLVGVVAALTVMGLGAARRVADEEAAEEAIVAAGDVAFALQETVDEAISELEDVAGQAAGTGSPLVVARIPPPEGFESIGWLTSSPDGTLAEAGGTVPVRLLTADELAAATARATDLGEVVVTAPIGADRAVLAAVPLYRTATSVTTVAAGSTEVRRATSAGWLVGRLEPIALPANVSELAGVRDGETTLAGQDSASPVREFPVAVQGRTWTVGAVPADAELLTGRGWLIGTAGLVAIGGIVAAGIWVDRNRRAARRQALAYRAQADAIHRLAPILQASLDLAEVVPSLALELVDHFELRGLSLAAPGLAGTDLELFSIGTLATAAPAPTVVVPQSLTCGEGLVLALQRGGRTVATLRLEAGRDLTGMELDSIEAAAQLVTAALVNARTFEQQQEAVDRLRALDELKTVFLGTASHELRTPVTAVKGFANLLDERWEQLTEEQRRQFVDRINRNCAYLESLVQDLLDFSQLERGAVVLGTEDLGLDELVVGLLDRMGPVWATHTIEPDIRAHPRVRADRAGLDRVLTNLVSNAVKFSPPGSTVDVAVDIADGHARLVVDDAGPGVPAADRERIFVSFFRGSGSEVVRTRGAGIGLSVAKQYVDHMGGTIEVTDSPSGGARFVVSLPLTSQGAAGSTSPTSSEEAHAATT